MKTTTPKKTVTPNQKILFLDDEPNILRSLGRLASHQGLEAVTFSDPTEALAHLRAHSIGVVVSDHRMPKVTGTEFLAQVRSLSPQSIRILLTGYADIGTAIQAVNESQAYKFVSKPWNDQELKDVFTSAFRQYNLEQENQRLQERIKTIVLKLKQANDLLEKRVEHRTREVQELNRKLESSFLASIKLFGDALLRGDPRLAEHVRRVTSLCMKIARELGWESKDLFELQVAAYLHKAGGNAASANPQESVRLMRSIPNLGRAYDYVEHHLEPCGSPSASSQMGARILGVAVGFDERMHLAADAASATAHRVLMDLKEDAARRYDPVVIAALANVMAAEGALEDGIYETRVNLFGLLPGMVLARELRTRSGMAIAAPGLRLTEDYLSRLLKRHGEDPIVSDIYVFKKSVPSPSPVRREV